MHCHHFIVSSYQRWEVGSEIAVHTFPNLPDCLDLHLQKNHRVLKQSTWNQSLNTLYSVFIWKIHVYVSNANVYKWYINFIKNLNTTHQRQKIYKRSPRPVERWAHQLEYLDEIKDLNKTQWFLLVLEIGIKKLNFVPVSPFGELVVMALKMLTRTRKRVTRSAIRPCNQIILLFRLDVDPTLLQSKCNCFSQSWTFDLNFSPSCQDIKSHSNI